MSKQSEQGKQELAFTGKQKAFMGVLVAAWLIASFMPHTTPAAAAPAVAACPATPAAVDRECGTYRQEGNRFRCMSWRTF